jgi:hypothetical protein
MHRELVSSLSDSTWVRRRRSIFAHRRARRRAARPSESTTRKCTGANPRHSSLSPASADRAPAELACPAPQILSDGTARPPDSGDPPEASRARRTARRAPRRADCGLRRSPPLPPPLHPRFPSPQPFFSTVLSFDASQPSLLCITQALAALHPVCYREGVSTPSYHWQWQQSLPEPRPSAWNRPWICSQVEQHAPWRRFSSSVRHSSHGDPKQESA